jgi:hypothetical protein
VNSFARAGQKTSPQKNEGIENGNNLREKNGGSGLARQLHLLFPWRNFSAHVEFTSRHFAKRTRR